MLDSFDELARAYTVESLDTIWCQRSAGELVEANNRDCEQLYDVHFGLCPWPSQGFHQETRLSCFP